MIAAEDIEMEFEAQLRRISDTSLREKVVETWYRSCRVGGLNTIQELQELPFTVAADARGITLLQHTRAATEGAVALAGVQMQAPSFPRVDMDTLVAGALLHDINKVLLFKRDEKGEFTNSGAADETTSFLGVAIARETTLPDRIVGLIEYECGKTEKPNSVEDILVHHADGVTFDTMNFLDGENRLTIGE